MYLLILSSCSHQIGSSQQVPRQFFRRLNSIFESRKNISLITIYQTYWKCKHVSVAEIGKEKDSIIGFSVVRSLGLVILIILFTYTYIAPQIQHHILFIGNMFMMVKIKKGKKCFIITPFQITDFIGTKESETFCTLNILAQNIWWLYSVLENNLMVIQLPLPTVLYDRVLNAKTDFEIIAFLNYE